MSNNGMNYPMYKYVIISFQILSISLIFSNLSYPHIVQQPSLYGQQYSNTLSQVQTRLCII
jgi:hypothetical protein